jgi:hypothetical protein
MMLGRLRWAARTTRRPRTLSGYLRLLWHDFILHGLFGPGGERCQDCGRSYPLWHAEGDLWDRVQGNRGGLLCPSCFSRRARESGLSVEFRAVPFPYERVSP